MQSLPSRAAPQSLIVEIQRQYNLPDIFYFDTFPFGPPMLVAMHPDISNQFTVKQSLPKHPGRFFLCLSETDLLQSCFSNPTKPLQSLPTLLKRSAAERTWSLATVWSGKLGEAHSTLDSVLRIL